LEALTAAFRGIRLVHVCELRHGIAGSECLAKSRQIGIAGQIGLDRDEYTRIFRHF
jgi:hypothetical protein